MPDASALAEKLRELHTQIIDLANGLLQLADLLEVTSQDENDTPRFLSEVQFAAFLGTTVAALRTRRFRKQIPENIWIKDGRRTLYSVEAYEQWIQIQLQSRLSSFSDQQQKNTKRKRLTKLGQVKSPFPLLV
jgi:hypothetical protein